MDPPRVLVVPSRLSCGEAIEASEIGTEILLYFMSTKEERYAIIAAVRTCKLVETKNPRAFIPAEVCKAKAPDNVA